MASSTALPLKVTPATPAKNSTESETADKTPLARKGTTTPKPTMGVTNISSPHELTAFDIINGDLSVSQSPSPIPGTPGGLR
ncbi:hypothetical protein HHX47_DHR7000348 [Lentinula edodes]|nr:hypothetical protein HHX47_DHR7000348 [Lentinula edodes]